MPTYLQKRRRRWYAILWAEPDRSIIEPRRKPPEFPLQILGGWQTWIKATAQSRSAPVDYVAVSLLSLLSSVIGNSRRPSPWDGWVEPVTLWTAMVGNPSSGKRTFLSLVFVVAHYRRRVAAAKKSFRDSQEKPFAFVPRRT